MFRQPPPAGNPSSLPQSEHEAWLEKLNDLLPAISDSDGLLQLGADLPNLKVRAFFKKNPTCLLGGYIAEKRSDFGSGGGWKVMRITPSSFSTTAVAIENLLPLPESIQLHCRRIGEDGGVQCEVIMSKQNLTQLTDFWRNHGWEVTRSEETQSVGNMLFCRRGDRVMEVTSYADSSRAPCLLTIVSADCVQRTPSIPSQGNRS